MLQPLPIHHFQVEKFQPTLLLLFTPVCGRFPIRGVGLQDRICDVFGDCTPMGVFRALDDDYEIPAARELSI